MIKISICHRIFLKKILLYTLSFSAFIADLLPLSASDWRLDFLAEMTAISAIAKRPFSSIRMRIINISSNQS